MSEHSHDQPRRFSEEEAREVLARAIDLDQLKHNGLTLEQLSEAASHVGISRDSLESAVAELATRSGTATFIGFSWRAMLAGAAIGILMTGNSAFPISAGSYSAWPRTALLLATVVTAGLSTGLHAYRRFHIRNTGLWVGFAATQVLVVAAAAGTAWLPSILGATVYVSITGWIAGSVLGSGLVWFFQRSRSNQDAAQGTRGPGGNTGRTWHTRFRKSMHDWLVHIVQKLEFSQSTLFHAHSAARRSGKR